MWKGLGGRYMALDSHKMLRELMAKRRRWGWLFLVDDLMVL